MKTRLRIFEVFAIMLVLLFSVGAMAQNRTTSEAEKEKIAKVISSPTYKAMHGPQVKMEAKANNLWKSNRGHEAYGFDAITSTFFSMDLDAPETFTDLAASTLAGFVCAGTWADGEWIIVEYGDGVPYKLHKADPTTGATILVGELSTGINGLAYDNVGGQLYGVDYDGTSTALYTIDMTNATATFVGQTGAGLLIGLAADSDGNLFGVDLLDDNFYSVDKTTGAATIVGSLGIDLAYAQDLEYDRDNGIMYLAGYVEATAGALYTVDVASGATTLVGAFQAGDEVCGFAIPYIPAPAGSPEAPADLVVTEGVDGALEFTATWTNPALQVSGDVLTELTTVDVYLNDGTTPVHTVSSPIIGADYEITTPIIVIESGYYTVTVVGTNSEGTGISASVTLYIGLDVPAAVTDVTLTADGMNGHLTWVNPTEGLNGAYWDGSITQYTITRSDGAEFTTSGPATEYTDIAVPILGNYYYVIQTENASGFGGVAFSEAVVLAAGDLNFVTVGDGDDTSVENPFNFYYQNSLASTMYYPNELEAGGVITHIAYYNTFVSDLSAGKPVKIWMTETQEVDLEAGYISSDNMTSVFEGDINLPDGDNMILIELTTPFTYLGGNLVLMTNRPMDTEYFSSADNFMASPTDGVIRSISNRSDYEEYNPAIPPTNPARLVVFPNTSFFFDTDGLGVVSGIITDEVSGDPIEGAEVYIELNATATGQGNNSVTTTDEFGAYEFSYVIPNEYDVSVVAHSYTTSVEQNVTVIDGETTTVDVAMALMPTYTLSAHIVGNDGVDLENAAFSFDGYSLYEDAAGVGGLISIDGFYTIVDGTYDLTVSMPGYETHTETITVTAEGDLDLGDVVLNEIYYPAVAPSAELVDGNVEGDVNVKWYTPETAPGVFEEFNGNSLPANWVVSDEAKWSVGDGYLIMTGNGAGQNESAYYDMDFTDFTVESKMQKTTGDMNYNMGFFFRSDGHLNYTSSNGYRVMYFVSNGDFRVTRLENGAQTTIIEFTATNYNSDPGSDNIVKVVGSGSDFEIFVNDVSEATFSDDTYPSGKICVYGYDAGATDVMKFDYVTIIMAATKVNVSKANNVVTTPISEFTTGEFVSRTAIESPAKIPTGYSVYQLLEEDEANQGNWTTVSSGLATTASTVTDTDNWPPTADGVYKYAVAFDYTTGSAEPAFTNSIPYGMEDDVTINVTTNSTTTSEGASIILESADNTYTATMDASGTVVLSDVWNDTYSLTVSLDGFITHTQEVIVTDPMSVDVELQQIILTVNVTTNLAATGEGAVVTFTGANTYTETVTSTGTVTIEGVVEGNYSLSVALDGFDTHTESVEVTASASYDVELGEAVVVPTNLDVVVDGANATFTWETGAGGSGGTGDEFTDSFETYDDFVLDFTPWTNVDVDASATYHITGIDFTNTGSPMAYIVFNPNSTTPAMDPMANTGDKFAASFAATTPPNNDWLITPQLTAGDGWEFSMFVKTHMADYGLERYAVGVSTTGTNPEDFTIISTGDYLEAPVDSWAEVSFDLSAYAGQDVYVGIHCVSHDAFIFLVDDVHFGAAKSKAFQEFKVYLDDMTTPVATGIGETTLSYLFEDLENGSHTAGVQSVFETASSDVVTIDFSILTGINDINGAQIVMYPNPTKDVLNITNVEGATITIYTTLGQVVETKVSNETNATFNMTNFENGTYIVKITKDDQIRTARISVVK